jgi:branched-chain amino acid transport system permease protein
MRISESRIEEREGHRVIAFGQFLEVLIGGLLSGVLYSLVALGFVLIFKASGVFNFAQGAMVLLAGLALVRSLDFLAAKGFPMWMAIILGLAFAAVVMAISAWLIERYVLGPLVNQDGLILFMSTIGVTFILEGASQMIFGAEIYPLRLFPTDAWFLAEDLFPGGILLNKLDVWGGLIAGVLVAGLAVFFQKTKTGRALRAVADDHAAAQSVGIPISWIWFVVWLVAGLVALVAATVWGTKLGVQFSITFLALKALPVLIIGGFTSVPGAIIGGLTIGAGEKLAEAYLGPHIGGGIEYWFGFVLALAVLMVRPQGLFGERIIERV